MKVYKNKSIIGRFTYLLHSHAQHSQQF